jgi:hypothetical protein
MNEGFSTQRTFWITVEPEIGCRLVITPLGVSVSNSGMMISLRL